MAALWGSLVLLAYEGTPGRLRRCLENPVLVWLGTVSFGIYLLHLPVCYLVFIGIKGVAPVYRTPGDVGAMAMGLAVTFLAPQLSYRFFERPILEIGHRYRY